MRENAVEHMTAMTRGGEPRATIRAVGDAV
jgi:hypothetical protein